MKPRAVRSADKTAPSPSDTTSVSRLTGSARQPRQSQTAALEQPPRPVDRRGRADQLRGCYTIGQICALLNIKRRTFYDLKDAGQLPFLEELQPRLGRLVRYRAALVDAYLDNRLNRTA